MESITIYPENEKQQSLIKSSLKEMSIRFEIGKVEDQSLLSKSDFFAKIDTSIKQAESGKITELNADQQKELLGL